MKLCACGVLALAVVARSQRTPTRCSRDHLPRHPASESIPIRLLHLIQHGNICRMSLNSRTRTIFRETTSDGPLRQRAGPEFGMPGANLAEIAGQEAYIPCPLNATSKGDYGLLGHKVSRKQQKAERRKPLNAGAFHLEQVRDASRPILSDPEPRSVIARRERTKKQAPDMQGLESCVCPSVGWIVLSGSESSPARQPWSVRRPQRFRSPRSCPDRRRRCSTSGR